MPFPKQLHSFAGQSIHELAEKFGTPVYVYDAAKIVERVNDLQQFDLIRFAQKACSNLAVLDLMRHHGVVVDAVSAGEVARATAAGYRPGPCTDSAPEVVYTADIFDRSSLDLVIEQDMHVNCGSPDMIDQYGERCSQLGRQRGITLRINPGFGHGHSQKVNTGGSGSKHGIWHEQIGECVQKANSHGLSITGLHMHIGSGTDLDHLSKVCQAMEKIALEVGDSVQSISAGGGLPTPYKEEDQAIDINGYFELWNKTRDRLAERWGHPVELEIEPGRYLTAESGALIAEVRALKQMGDRQYCLVDAGFNNLARPVMYGAYHPIAICPREAAVPAEELPLVDLVVGGPLCESGDIFTQEEGGFVCSRSLPAPQVGDYLVIGVAGAYGAVMGSNYNSKPLAAEVLVDQGQAHLVRKRQTLQDLLHGELIPGSKS